MPTQKGFLEELQSLDESVKKRVLIISTIVIMIIVIGVWFAYFNSIVASMSSATVSQVTTTTSAAAVAIAITPTATTPAAPSGPGLWQNIENVFSSVYRSIANVFSQPSNYQVQPN